MRRLLALICITAGTVACSDGVSRPGGLHEQCAVVEALLTDELAKLDGPAVFTTSDDAVTDDPLIEGEPAFDELASSYRDMRWQVVRRINLWSDKSVKSDVLPNEAAQLVYDFVATNTHRNAIPACARAGQLLQSNQIEVGDQAVERVLASRRDSDDNPTAIIGLSLPSTSPSGRYAVVLETRIWAPLAGVGVLIILERNEQGWSPAYAAQTWVS